MVERSACRLVDRGLRGGAATALLPEAALPATWTVIRHEGGLAVLRAELEDAWEVMFYRRAGAQVEWCVVAVPCDPELRKVDEAAVIAQATEFAEGLR